MKLAHHHLLFPFLLDFAFARNIIFSPVAGYRQNPIREFGGIDISTGSAFSGLTTFANLPYVHCLAGEGRKVQKFDIAILGARFDTVGLGSMRKGGKRSYGRKVPRDSNGLITTNRIGCHSQTRRAVRSRRYPSRFEKNGARRCLEYIHRSVLFVLFYVSSSHSLVYLAVFPFMKPYLSKWERRTMHWYEGGAEQLTFYHMSHHSLGVSNLQRPLRAFRSLRVASCRGPARPGRRYGELRNSFTGDVDPLTFSNSLDPPCSAGGR